MMNDQNSITQRDHSRPGFAVAQIGAREYYAVPRMLKRIGRLDSLYVDIWLPPTSALHRIPGVRQRAGARFAGDLVDVRIYDRTRRELASRLKQKVCEGRRKRESYENWIRDGARFGRWVRACLASSDRPPEGVIGFSFGAREIFEWAASTGLRTIHNQVDAAEANSFILAEELEAGRANCIHRIPKSNLWARLREEWALATVVVVNSEWSRAQLVRQGVPEQKIAIVPCALARDIPRKDERKHRRVSDREPLQVLYVGRLNTLKGLWYLLEAMKGIPSSEAQLTCVGPVEEESLLSNGRAKGVAITGRLEREDLAAHLLRADVLAFPTLSDGFGLVQLEAFAAGLPVIATDRCGSVVTHGVDGLLVPARSAEALKEAILALARDREALAAMAAATKAKLFQFSTDAVSKAWARALSIATGNEELRATRDVR